MCEIFFVSISLKENLPKGTDSDPVNRSILMLLFIFLVRLLNFDGAHLMETHILTAHKRIESLFEFTHIGQVFFPKHFHKRFDRFTKKIIKLSVLFSIFV